MVPLLEALQEYKGMLNVFPDCVSVHKVGLPTQNLDMMASWHGNAFTKLTLFEENPLVAGAFCS